MSLAFRFQFKEITGKLSPNFTFWDDSTWGWSSIDKLFHISETGEREALWRTKQGALVQSAGLVWCRQFSYNFLTLRAKAKKKTLHVCWAAVSIVWCASVCRCSQELCVRDSGAVWRALQSGMMSHSSSTSLLGTFPGFENRRTLYPKLLFKSSSIRLATLIFYVTKAVVSASMYCYLSLGAVTLFNTLYSISTFKLSFVLFSPTSTCLTTTKLGVKNYFKWLRIPISTTQLTHCSSHQLRKSIVY